MRSAHPPDGTAELLGPDPRAFTLSLHCARNYPFTRIPSDVDINRATARAVAARSQLGDPSTV